ncbi:alpha/beta hydrolase [Mycolicibacterium neoaurum]|uniref:alpha/beta hydrolase n=1 Tax=Mycolicibacterium neoaurum TaxID=1795 RepID=UPI002673D984|nr:alpha/beta hydrolase [Mycolicibacterium neoaurum]MDO3399688.1 alpha/beta hydrolase [Mycolicibacterium neoaurum]
MSTGSGVFMERVSAWVSAGLLSAGVSAAVLAGAGAAVADDTSGGAGPGSASSPANDNTPRTKTDTTSESPAKSPSDRQTDTNTDSKTDSSISGAETEHETGSEVGTEPELQPKPEPKPEPEVTAPTPEPTPTDGTGEAESVLGKKTRPAAAIPTVTGPVVVGAENSTPAEAENGTGTTSTTEPSAPLVTEAEVTSERILDRDATTARVSEAPAVSMAVVVEQPPAERAFAPAGPNLLRWLQGLTENLIKGVGSLVFNTIQALEALLTGPPAVPVNSPVTVRTSTILLANGQRVQANWYFPDVPEGAPQPDRLILLQHGFFALAPMYSYTAAELAVRTNSIVVTPTLSSNFFADDDAWLNGAGMWNNIAELFVGDRTALKDSARDAGYVGVLPQKFGLAGHSAGGQLVGAVAGYLVDKGAADDLVGVITLDGVPTGSVMPDALAKLQAYEDATGRYIPVREIGAPPNLFNFISNINESLNEARPGRFNGVVLAGGVHMDSMRGGNPIVQFLASVLAGFPQPQNPPAVWQLSAEWFNDWFDGDTDNGDDLVPGSTLPISTPDGTAYGVVLGRAVPAPATVAAIV